MFVKKMFFPLLLVAIILLIPGCNNWFTRTIGLTAHIISAEELKNKIEKDSELMVINVLEEEAFDDCHIKDSINIPFAELEESISHLDKNQEIIVYCASEVSPLSQIAYDTLKKAKFKKLYLFKGGMKEWHEKNFESVGPCKASYLTGKNIEDSD